MALGRCLLQHRPHRLLRLPASPVTPPAGSDTAAVVTTVPAGSDTAAVVTTVPAGSDTAAVVTTVPAGSDTAAVVTTVPAGSDTAAVVTTVPAGSDTAAVVTTVPASSTPVVTEGPSKAPSTNGFDVIFTKNVSWSVVRGHLRELICGGKNSYTNHCEGYGSDEDLYVIGGSVSDVADKFVVSCNQSWMLYQDLAIPSVALEKEFKSPVSIHAAAAVPTELADRGANQLELQTVYTGRTNQWYPFVEARNDMMKYLYGKSARRMMELVNGSCNTVAAPSVSSGDFYYNCTWIVSMQEVTQQVEIAGIKWKVFNDEGVHPNYVSAQSLYPPHVDLDETTANALDNRVEFQFVYDEHKKYETFANFAQAIVAALNSHSDATPSANHRFASLEDSSKPLTLADLHLVKSSVYLTKNGTMAQNFTVSFPTADTQKKAVTLMASPETASSALGSKVHVYSAAAVASPVRKTDAPAQLKSGDGASSPKKNHTVLIVAVVVSILVVALVAAVLVVKSKKSSTPKYEVEEEEMMKEHRINQV